MLQKIFRRIYHPELFQGSLGKKNYFEGWYFKLVSENGRKALAVIPGISLSPKKKTAFIQVIDGVTGHAEYFEYPIREFRFDRSRFAVSVGESHFSLEKITLDIKKKIRVSGEVRFQDPVPYPVTLLSPGIMGAYRFVPTMECYHAVVSMDHGLQGSVRVNGKKWGFDGGRGYIEKDWGRSFPQSWLWLQCNHFGKGHEGTSLMVSVADIPWRGSSFTGLAAFFRHAGRFYPFTTPEKTVIRKAEIRKHEVHILLRGREASLEIRARLGKSGTLRAPQNGRMERRIKESVNSEVEVTLYDSRNMVVFQGTGRPAGLEITGNILERVGSARP